MATTNTTYLQLVKPTAGTNQTWSSGALFDSNMDILDKLSWSTYNVLIYGATGNGTTDDSTAFQAALDAAGTRASSTNGAVVLIPPGIYRMDARLHVQSYVTVYAYGAYIFKGGTPATGMLANFITATDSFAGYAGNSHIRLLGGIWDGKAQNAATNAAFDILDFNHATDILVKDVTVRNGCSDHGLEFNSTNGGMAINCRFEGFRDATSGLTRQISEAIQVDCANTGSATIPLFDGTHSKNILIQGCYQGPATDGSGLGSYGKLVGSHATAAGKSYDKIIVIGNTSDGSLDDGIQVYNWTNSIVANNVIENATGHGIEILVPDPSVVGFSVLGRNVTIANNNISTTGGGGITILGYTTTASYTDLNVTGNSVYNAGAQGLVATLSVGPFSIAGNVFDTTTSNAISINGCSTVKITGNYAANVASNYGIFLGQAGSTSTLDCLVEGNYAINCSTAAYRVSTGCQRNTFVGNIARKGASGSAIAMSMNPGSGLVNTVANNDFSGYGDNTTTITITSGSPNLTFPGTTHIGTNLA
jgi:hypothetical protein